MLVKNLSVSNFRNISKARLEPSEGVNVIYGENAQGKTNILEAIWLLTGFKSFRAKRDGELVKFKESFSKVEALFYGHGRNQETAVFIDSKRTAEKNGVKLKTAAELISSFYAVIFTPAHLNLIKNGPEHRRKFIDTALCQLKPNYAKSLALYQKTLKQRNSLLKDIFYHAELLDTLDIWDEKLAFYGAEVSSERIKYIKLLTENSEKIYEGISNGKEKFSAEYVSNAEIYSGNAEEIKDKILNTLKKNRKEEIYQGITGTGPHRDDLEIKINNISARKFASQGQQRSAALCLKLSEGEILKSITGENPVILLDDVMSELDIERQNYILNNISDKQVFITCCEPDAHLRSLNGKSFNVKSGKLL